MRLGHRVDVADRDEAVVRVDVVALGDETAEEAVVRRRRQGSPPPQARRRGRAGARRPGRVDEPRRVVVAVAAPRAVDEHAVRRPEPCDPQRREQLVREGAQPRAPLLLHGRRDRVGRGGRRSRPRRVREDVHLRDPGAPDDVERAREGLARLSPGKPTMTSVVRLKSSRRLELRDVLRGRVAPPHRREHVVVARLERDVEVPRRPSASRAAPRSSSSDRWFTSIEESRSRSTPGTAPASRTSRASVYPASRSRKQPRLTPVRTISRWPWATRRAISLEHRVRAPAPRPTAHERDDAERARERAAVLDLHERARALEPRVGLHAADRADVAGDRGRRVLAEQRRRPSTFAGEPSERACEVRGAARHVDAPVRRAPPATPPGATSRRPRA